MGVFSLKMKTAHKYINRVALLLFFGILLLLAVPLRQAFASNSYDVVFQVIDENTASIKVTYDVLDGQKYITALSSHLSGNLREGYRDLISAYADNGSAREITHNNSVEDAHIEIKEGDKKITIEYKLQNSAKSIDISFFNFLLFFGNEYPRVAKLKVLGLKDYEIVNFTGFEDSVQQPDASYLTTIKTDMPESRLSSKGIYVLVYPKKTSSFVKKTVNNFAIFGLPSVVNKVASSVERLGNLDDFFKKIFGQGISGKVSVVISRIYSNRDSYEVIGNALGDSVIFIDPEGMLSSDGPNDLEKIITHEVAHLIVAKSQVFDGQVYIARWFNEGLAVFAEQYMTDQYLIKDKDSRNIDTTLSKFIKLNKAELSSEYSKGFDYNINKANGSSIDKTYSHAGLIFYNLFLMDRAVIPNLLASLRNKQSDPLCADCDSNLILSEIRKITGMDNDSIIYPYKNDLQNKNLDKLTVEDVNRDLKIKIKGDKLKSIGTFIDQDAPVEEFVVPTNTSKNPVSKIKKAEVKSISTNVENINQKDISKNPTDTSDNKTDKALQNNDLEQMQKQEQVDGSANVSLFNKIKEWFLGLFK